MSGLPQINSVVHEPDGVDGTNPRRVLWYAPRDFVILFPLDADLAMPEWVPRQELIDDLANGRITVRLADPFVPRAVRNQHLSDAARRIRDARWRVIEPLVTDSDRCVFVNRRRSCLIRERSEITGSSVTNIYVWLRLWWRYGQVINGLVPDFHLCGAPGEERDEPGPIKLGRPRLGYEGRASPGHNLTRAERKVCKEGAEKHLRAGRSMRDAYDLTMLRELAVKVKVAGEWKLKLPDEIPITYAQFKYHARSVRNEQAEIEAKKGSAEFHAKNRGTSGSTLEHARYPGHVYQVDATPGDIRVLSSFLDGRQIIGRPVIYIVGDLFSRMIVGLHIGVGPPSWEGAMQALANAMTNKVQFCAEYGITITEDQWPCRYRGDELWSDRGPEFTAKINAHAGGRIGYVPTTLPPFRGDWKGFIERTIGVFNESHEEETGYIEKRTHGPKRRFDAVFTLRHIWRRAIRFVLFHNNQRLSHRPLGFRSSSALNPTRLEAWNYTHSGAPQDPGQEFAYVALQRRLTVRAQQSGLHWRGLDYTCPTAMDEQWFVDSGRGSWRSHEMSIESRDVGRAWIWLPDGRFERAMLTGNSAYFNGCTIDEVDHFFRLQSKEKYDDEARRLANKGAFFAHAKEIGREAAREAAERGGGARPRVENMRAARALEHRFLQAEAVARLNAAETPPALLAPAATPPNPSPDYRAFPSQLDRLRRARNQQENN